MALAPTIDQLIAETIWTAESADGKPVELLLGPSEISLLTQFVNNHFVIGPEIETVAGTTFMGVLVSPMPTAGVAVRCAEVQRE